MKKRELENNRENSPRLSKKVAERPAQEPVSQETSSPDLEPCLRTTTLPGEAVSPQTHATLLNRAKAAGVSQANQVLRHLQGQYGNLYVQRVVDLARKGEEEPDVTPEVEQAIQSKRGSGQDLDKGVRSQMESAMGADFGGVRVHTDGEADTLNRHLKARAFTTGQDIFFRQGTYNPGSSTGRELLAHELTHVVQQTDGLRKKMTLGQSDDKYEQEADEVARAVVQREWRIGPQNVELEKVQNQVEKEEELVQGKADTDKDQWQTEEEKEESIQVNRVEGCVQRQPEEKKEAVKEWESLRPLFKQLIKGPSTYTLFPIFAPGTGLDVAYAEIERQLPVNPRSPEMTLELLSTVRVTKPRLRRQFSTVLNQIRLELHLKQQVEKYFSGLKSFVIVTHQSFQNRLNIVGRLMELKTDDVVGIFITRLVSEGFEAIGEIKHPAAVMVSEALKIIWDTYTIAAKVKSENKVSLALVNQISKLDTEFNRAFDNIEKIKKNILTDWAMLQKIGRLRWPMETKALRAAAGRGFEISVWKSLLPTKWKHMTSSDDPTFSKGIDWIEGYYRKVPNSYITYKPGVSGLIWQEKGYWLTHHWIGSGSFALTHTSANKAIALRLFEKLGLSRRELFEQWNLPRQTMVVPKIERR